VEVFLAIYYGFLFFWVFGGLALFAWLRAYRIRQAYRKAKEVAKEASIVMVQAAGMLAPFLIPIIVSIICLVAG
jgi:hypothetical protein